VACRTRLRVARPIPRLVSKVLVDLPPFTSTLALGARRELAEPRRPAEVLVLVEPRQPVAPLVTVAARRPAGDHEGTRPSKATRRRPVPSGAMTRGPCAEVLRTSKIRRCYCGPVVIAKKTKLACRARHHRTSPRANAIFATVARGAICAVRAVVPAVTHDVVAHIRATNGIVRVRTTIETGVIVSADRG
jgi:hypothetical protein